MSFHLIVTEAVHHYCEKIVLKVVDIRKHNESLRGNLLWIALSTDDRIAEQPIPPRVELEFWELI